jgi:hypothetical protein
MRRRRKRKRILRKQPRRLTPPLFLKGNDGERNVIEVDEEQVTQQVMESTRTLAFLVLSDGLRVRVGSRCINKRRIPVLRISAWNYTPPQWKAPSPTFTEIKQGKET